MEDIDGGLHPTVDGQSLDEDEDEVPQYHAIRGLKLKTLIMYPNFKGMCVAIVLHDFFLYILIMKEIPLINVV